MTPPREIEPEDTDLNGPAALDGPFEAPPDREEEDLFPELHLDDFQLDTLYGDVRDALLTRFQQAPHPWPRMSEQEQRETVEAFGITARRIIREVVRAVTDHDFPRCVVTLGDMKIIGGEKTRIEAKITAPNFEEYRNTLGDHVGSMVTLVMIDSEDFMGSRGEPQIDKDQPDLPLEGEATDVTPPEEAEEPTEADDAGSSGADSAVPEAAE